MTYTPRQMECFIVIVLMSNISYIIIYHDIHWLLWAILGFLVGMCVGSVQITYNKRKKLFENKIQEFRNITYDQPFNSLSELDQYLQMKQMVRQIWFEKHNTYLSFLKHCWFELTNRDTRKLYDDDGEMT